MMGLASCIGCHHPHAGDSLVRDIATAKLATVAEWQPEHFEDAVREAESAVATVRATDGAERHHGPDAHRHAVHEAAHAVVALILGMRVDAVNIDGSLQCDIGGCAPSDTSWASLYLAGRCAEQRNAVREPQSEARLSFSLAAARSNHRGRCDECQAMRAFLRHRPAATDVEVIAHYRELQANTARFVWAPPVWPAVQRIADALVERGHLSGDEVVALAGPEITGSRP